QDVARDLEEEAVEALRRVEPVDRLYELLLVGQLFLQRGKRVLGGQSSSPGGEIWPDQNSRAATVDASASVGRISSPNHQMLRTRAVTAPTGSRSRDTFGASDGDRSSVLPRPGVGDRRRRRRRGAGVAGPSAGAPGIPRRRCAGGPLHAGRDGLGAR